MIQAGCAAGGTICFLRAKSPLSETAARDAVKKEALRRAGIGYVEVVSGDTPAEVKEMVRKLVERGKV